MKSLSLPICPASCPNEYLNLWLLPISTSSPSIHSLTHHTCFDPQDSPAMALAKVFNDLQMALSLSPFLPGTLSGFFLPHFPPFQSFPQISFAVYYSYHSVPCNWVILPDFIVLTIISMGNFQIYFFKSTPRSFNMQYPNSCERAPFGCPTITSNYLELLICLNVVFLEITSMEICMQEVYWEVLLATAPIRRSERDRIG